MSIASDKQEMRVKRAHLTMMKHKDTALYSGVMLMGKTEVVDGAFTAYTDGVNKRYSRQFLETVDTDAKLRGLILHENLHVALKQVAHGKAMFKDNPTLANVAADLVVNDVIQNITSTVKEGRERLVELPDGALYDPMFHNWSMRDIYRHLRKENPDQDKQKGDGGGGDGDGQSSNNSQGGEQLNKPSNKVSVNGKQCAAEFDEHDFNESINADPEKAKQEHDAIDRALREGAVLAGRLGGDVPRAVGELLDSKLDWREVLREFVTSSTKGKDDMSWRRLNKRYIMNDIYLPTHEQESVGEIVVAIDTSGSIMGEQLTAFVSELASICEVCQPEKVRVLWWDYHVHGEQVFEGNYDNLVHMLKPEGGGGTRVSSVNDYVTKHRITPECIIVLTDGFVEHDVQWDVTAPTLWVYTYHDFEPSVGKVVKLDM